MSKPVKRSHPHTSVPDYKPSMDHNFVLTPESDSGGKIEPAEAKRRLLTVKQGSDCVLNYFDRCVKLVEIMNGRPVEKNDALFFSSFMNGLNERARRVVQHANITDAFAARKVAIQEEMFSTVSTLQPGVEEDRMHKLEILQHCQWEKLRSLEGKFNFVQHEVHQIKKDVGFIKDNFTEIQTTLNAIMVQTLKNAEEAKKPEKEPEPVPENKEEDNILGRVVEAQESLVAKLDSLQKIEKIEKVSALSYEWIRQVYKDVKKITQESAKIEPPQAVAPAAPVAAPAAASPLLPQAKIASPVNIKRSLSSCEEYPPQPPPKRFRRNEEAALELLHNRIPEPEFQKMLNGNMLQHIEDLLGLYSNRAEDIRGWMQQQRKPIKSPCFFCGNPEHHSYECDNITDIDERKDILRGIPSRCMECSNLHRGKCTAILSCRICTRAKDRNQMVLGGVAHCRMFCPLQEEFHTAQRVCKTLSDAQFLLLQ